jgi:hypothetical protein
MTHQQIIENYRGTVANLFNTYGIAGAVNAENLSDALVTYPTFSTDLYNELGMGDVYNNAGGRERRAGKRTVRKANTKQKKTDKANGISKGKPKKTPKQTSQLAAQVQKDIDNPDQTPTVANDVENEKYNPPPRRSTAQAVQEWADTAGAVGSAVGGIVSSFGRPNNDSAGAEYTPQADAPKGANGGDAEPSTFMDKVKKFWYIPVAVVVVVIAVVVVRHLNKDK